MLVVDSRRRIPRTDTLLAQPPFTEAVGRLGAGLVKEAITAAQDRARRGEIAPEDVPDLAAGLLPASATTLRPVINATGVLLHTNLGRAPLSGAARSALAASAGCTDVEFDLATGQRARRGRGALDALRAACPQAEAVHIVNNNAAALVLAATALASDREIVVSRGEMVEIGDGFRLPDLLASTGARLREVGTTNRTTVADYAAAIGPDTGFILKVHPSNFRVLGFTSEATIAELAAIRPAEMTAGTGVLGREPGPVPVVADIGSGLLAPEPVLPDEPDAATALASGAALVTASGDKLLGGPQAGLLLGRAGLITALRRHPLARALRVDKLTLAALEATLRGPATPTATALHEPVQGLRDRAARLAADLAGAGLDALAAESDAVVGGGGAPGVRLPSAAVSLPATLAGSLRKNNPPVAGRVEDGRLLLDLRTVDPADDAALRAAVLAAATASQDAARP
ncbi:MAG: L-seryl-tRNA(Ser) seleniumtransferase [Streptosporangiaceae bacterium]|nr:L-seryl-tRNA(Ser) seleniumtransferase [Streptosporangiaceae bacterium]